MCTCWPHVHPKGHTMDESWHKWISHVAFVNESCHTHVYLLTTRAAENPHQPVALSANVTCYMNESCVTRINESCYMYACVTPHMNAFKSGPLVFWANVTCCTHTWMSHVTYMNHVVAHMYAWDVSHVRCVTSHVWTRYVTYMSESLSFGENVTWCTLKWMSHVTYMNHVAAHINEWDMSRILCDVTCMNETCHTYEGVFDIWSKCHLVHT